MDNNTYGSYSVVKRKWKSTLLFALHASVVAITAGVMLSRPLVCTFV